MYIIGKRNSELKIKDLNVNIYNLKKDFLTVLTNTTLLVRKSNIMRAYWVQNNNEIKI